MTNVLSIRTYGYRRQKDARFTESLIDCYARVFAGPPWNERWERGDVVAMLEQTDPRLSFIACEGKEVIGFAFAKSQCAETLERKLDIPLSAEIAKRAYGGADPKVLLYQADLGVLAERRGEGIAKRLFKARFMASGHAYQIVRARVTPEPSVTYLWYTEKLGYEVIAHYPDEDGRVILFQRGDVLVRLTRSWES